MPRRKQQIETTETCIKQFKCDSVHGKYSNHWPSSKLKDFNVQIAKVGSYLSYVEPHQHHQNSTSSS